MDEVAAAVREFEELTERIRQHKAGQREAAIKRREIVLRLHKMDLRDHQIGELLGLSRQRIERIRAGRDIGA